MEKVEKSSADNPAKALEQYYTGQAAPEIPAHYHHEWVNGTGCPEKLKGGGIPLEARIMAIADVYDALDSERVYKDKMSFGEADRIILEGMGTHFDSKLRRYYELTRPKLEEYYKSTQEPNDQL